MYEKKKISLLYFTTQLNRNYSIGIELFKHIDYRVFYSLNKNIHIFNYRSSSPYFYFCHSNYGTCIQSISLCAEHIANVVREFKKELKWYTTIKQKEKEIESLKDENRKIDECVTCSEYNDMKEVSVRQLVGLNNQKIRKKEYIINTLVNQNINEYIQSIENRYFIIEKFLSYLLPYNIVNSYLFNIQLSEIDLLINNDDNPDGD